MMKVVALILAILMVMSYIKTFKTLLKSPRKIEKDFKEMLKLQYKTHGRETAQISMCIGIAVAGLFVSLSYIITASVIGSTTMILLASLMVIRGLFSAWKITAYVLESTDEYRLGAIDKLFSFLGVGYLIAFFILFFS